MTTGIFTVADLLKQTLTSAVDYDLTKIYDIINDDLKNYNSQVDDMLGAFTSKTQSQTVVFQNGGSDDFVEMDEFGTPTTRKGGTKFEVSFPVRKFQKALGWTREFLQAHTPAELAATYTDLQAKDAKNIVTMVKKSIFNKDNVTFVDTHYNAASLTLRRFWNADSAAIPVNTSGSSFVGASHTHYNAISGSAVTSQEVDNLISNVTEHDQTSGVRLYINGTNLADLSALTKFKALSSAMMVYNATDVTVAKLDNSDLSNYMVGVWDGQIEVWIKAWIPAGYVLCMATEMNDKPLAYRELPYPSMQGLKLDSMVAVEPLISQTATRYGGIAVLNRSAGAVLEINASTWANPSL